MYIPDRLRGNSSERINQQWRKAVPKKLEESPHRIARFFLPSSQEANHYLQIDNRHSSAQVIFRRQHLTTINAIEKAIVIPSEGDVQILRHLPQFNMWFKEQKIPEETRRELRLLKAATVFDANVHGEWLGIAPDLDNVMKVYNLH